jgi:steroid delta-isomerase-like uncharacterized protein
MIPALNWLTLKSCATLEEVRNIMSEQNNALVTRAVEEVWNRGNYAALDQLVTDDIVIHSSKAGEDIHGPEGITQFYSALRAAFPDIHFTIDDQIASKDKVVTRWTARGTHKGEFQGIPATNKPVKMTGIDIDRLVNGKVVECWPIVDEMDVLQQLSVFPASEQAER